MSRRLSRRWESDGALSLDSLVDVVTNINGMLVLLAVFATLLVAGKTYTVSFPMTRSTEKIPVFFECTLDRVLPMHQDGVFSDQYSVTSLWGRTVVSIKDGESGETAGEIASPTSRFQMAADSVVPSRHYAAFLVRPDSFEVFRAAREMLDARGIETGWEPLSADSHIAFGRAGRALHPQ